ncbi:MAG: class 1 fructose-bisphosphatase [Actinomycetes bacterium]
MSENPTLPDPAAMPQDLAAVLAEWTQRRPELADVADVIARLAVVGIDLARLVASSLLEPAVAEPVPGADLNPSGDSAKPLDLIAEDMFVAGLAGSATLAVCSEETVEPIAITAGGSLVLAIDPIDGSSNIDLNAPIGSIFGILPTAGFEGDALGALLQPGRSQLAAGIIVYGPSTVMALTLGEGTDLYVLDPGTGAFRLVYQRVSLPSDAREYAINASNARHWGPGIQAYVNDLVNGTIGPREQDFNMRWLASLVAETYRILRRGGIYMYPADARPGYSNGRLRLVYEANPVSFLCEQAGGVATDGITDILDLKPTSPHQKIPFIFGSRNKVERVRRYLTNPEPMHERSPLFSDRGLFRR